MKATKRTPQALAAEAADRYFAALVREIPFDTAPGDVNLINEAMEIQDQVLREDPRAKSDPQPAQEQAALTAGYLLGVEIGRRMGGVR
jgi:hypothetical protein